MATKKVVILMPYAEEVPQVDSVAPRLATLRGKTVGLVNNRWVFGKPIYQELRRLLEEQHGVADIIELTVANTRPLTDAEHENVARRADAVICGFGN